MAVRSFCLAISTATSVLLLVLALCALGVRGQKTTQKISVGFLNPTFSGKEGEVAAAIVKVEVPKDFKFGDSDESLTILVTSEDGEAKAGHDFEAVDSTIILTKEDLYKIKDDPTHQYIAVPISLTEDDYIEPSQTFTLTLEVQSTLDFGEGITSATFTITNEGSDTVKISFDQPTYTAYASQNAPLKLLKEGRIRQDISVDVVFSNGSIIQTILFKPSQNVIEVSFDPGRETATYSLSLALAEPSHNLEGVVVLGAPAEVKVLDFTPEGSRIIKLLEGKIQASVVVLQEEYEHLEGMYEQQYKYLHDNYASLQRKYYDLQEKYDYLQRKFKDAEAGYDEKLQEYGSDYNSSPSTPAYGKGNYLKVWFDQDYYTVRENSGVRVCLEGNWDYTYEDITVTVTAEEGSPASATGGRDFSTAPQKITIPVYSTYMYGSENAYGYNIDVIIDDNEKEGREFFILTLTVDTHPGVTSSATVTILDNDSDRKVVWVIVAVVIIIIILAVAIAAYVIYRQRAKIKECFCSPYKKLPTDVHIETVTF